MGGGEFPHVPLLVFIFSFHFRFYFRFPRGRRNGPPFRFGGLKLEGVRFTGAHFGRTSRFGGRKTVFVFWTFGKLLKGLVYMGKFAGSHLTGGALSQMCECVNASRVTHLRIRRGPISPLRGSNVGRFPYIQDT